MCSKGLQSQWCRKRCDMLKSLETVKVSKATLGWWGRTGGGYGGVVPRGGALTPERSHWANRHALCVAKIAQLHAGHPKGVLALVSTLMEVICGCFAGVVLSSDRPLLVGFDGHPRNMIQQLCPIRSQALPRCTK